MPTTVIICGICGKREEYDRAKDSGWLISQRKNHTEGHLVIRCPEHVTKYALKRLGKK